MSDMRLAVVGAAGRMGQSLIRTIGETSGAVLCGAFERTGAEALGLDSGVMAGLGINDIVITDDMQKAFANCEAIVDFTAPQATLKFAEYAAANNMVHVIGTTGCSAEDDEKIAEFAQKATIVKSGNMSLGVNLLGELVKQAAEALDAADFDIEVLEMHHKHKVDAPSGTALLLGQAAADGRNISLPENSVRVRDGHTGAREGGSIGFATLRGGSVVGEHSVILAGQGERIELNHIASDRSIFAVGAIKAAMWAKGRKPGLYSMLNVLGLA